MCSQYLRRLQRQVASGQLQDPREPPHVPATAAAPLVKTSLSAAAMQDFLARHSFGVSEDIARQRLGERIYPQIQLMEPLLAEKITGMLLELPIDSLEQLCCEPQSLAEHVHSCVEVLEEQWNQLEKTQFWDDDDFGIGIGQDCIDVEAHWDADEVVGLPPPRAAQKAGPAGGGRLNEQATRDLVSWLHTSTASSSTALGPGVTPIARAADSDIISHDGSTFSHDMCGDDSSVSGTFDGTWDGSSVSGTFDGTWDGSSQYSHSQCGGGSRVGDDFESDQHGADTTMQLSCPDAGVEARAQRAMQDLVENRGPAFIDAIPPSFLCPITHAVMRDPVMCSDGHTYERAAIKQWLHKHSRSPLTNAALESTGMIPNIALRQAIQELVLRNMLSSEALPSTEHGQVIPPPEAPMEEHIYARVEELICKVSVLDSEAIANSDLLTMLPCVLSGDRTIHQAMMHHVVGCGVGSKAELVSVLSAAIFAFEMYRIGESDFEATVRSTSDAITGQEAAPGVAGGGRKEDLRKMMRASIEKVAVLGKRWAVSNSEKPAIASFMYMCGCMNSFYPESAPPAELVSRAANVLGKELLPRIASLQARLAAADAEFVELAQRHAARAAEKVEMLSTRFANCAEKAKSDIAALDAPAQAATNNRMLNESMRQMRKVIAELKSVAQAAVEVEGRRGSPSAELHEGGECLGTLLNSLISHTEEQNEVGRELQGISKLAPAGQDVVAGAHGKGGQRKARPRVHRRGVRAQQQKTAATAGQGSSKSAAAEIKAGAPAPRTMRVQRV